MAETEKTLVEAGKEVIEATAPDAPKKNAVPAEPSPLKNDAEDQVIGDRANRTVRSWAAGDAPPL